MVPSNASKRETTGIAWTLSGNDSAQGRGSVGGAGWDGFGGLGQFGGELAHGFCGVF